MPHTLYLLDCMALVYRAHFSLVRSPIYTSGGINTSALFGFANMLIDLMQTRKPTHLAAVFDTSAPTQRHVDYPQYKAQRQDMPEDLALAIPNVKRMLQAWGIPVIQLDGYEADDLIGTLATQVEAAGAEWELFMVTPDKDFGQLVTERCRLFRPGRQGSPPEVLGPAEVCAQWGISSPDQVIDLLGLMGDAVDNIPGVPGVGEKTAAKLIQDHGSLAAALEAAPTIKGKLGESLRAHAESARLSYQLATIIRDAPIDLDLNRLVIAGRDDAALQAIFTEFEFNSLGRRVFGADFRAGRGHTAPAPAAVPPPTSGDALELDFSEGAEPASSLIEPTPPTVLTTIKDVPHTYHIVETAAERAALIERLSQESAFCFDVETTGLDPRTVELLGIAFSCAAHEAWFVTIASGAAREVVEEFRELFTKPGIEKIGHNLKYDLSVLLNHGLEVSGPFIDTMLIHALVEPDQRHGMDFLSEQYLGYTPISFTTLTGIAKPKGGSKKSRGATRAGQGDLFALDMTTIDTKTLAAYAAEDADVTWQLSAILRQRLAEVGQETIYRDIEAPLLPVLTRMEHYGVAIDLEALDVVRVKLQQEIARLEQEITEIAGETLNLNSPKQLGVVLFEKLKLGGEKPKKTAGGQYATGEQVLQSLDGAHPIITKILDYREATKLLNTYVDSLPATINPRTDRVHTTYQQLVALTGRLASTDPNLQNIPIRTELGREIRSAFVPGFPGWVLLSADYSQIELRLVAELSEDPVMREAFVQGIDIHTATAARVFGVPLDGVLSDMRRNAKMVNFGIIYGISSFGLAQRLQIPRHEAGKLIDEYWKNYPSIKRYMDTTLRNAQVKGYVSTLLGRKRWLRDINSGNASIRGSAERMAINAPIQGTAADLIKMAMVRVHDALEKSGFKARLLLQVHDELLLECPEEEAEAVSTLVKDEMRAAWSGTIPAETETGTGKNWLAAH